MEIDEASQQSQRIHRNSWMLFERHRLTIHFIQHPTGRRDSQIILQLHNNGRVLLRL